MKPDLSVNLAGIEMRNPVMVASGTFGKGKEYLPFMDLSRLGAIVTKGITLKKREGNPPPRVYETPCGLLNSIGLQNEGVDHFIKEGLPYLRKLSPPIIVNIAGESIDEYVALAQSLGKAFGVSALELNISCPNIKKGGMIFGTSSKLAAEVLIEVKKVTKLPLMVKLTPNVTDINEIALAVEKAGADCISLVNTFLGMAIDPENFKSRLAQGIGGLSGPAIKPLALRMVWEVASKVKLPVVGMGGIMTTSDALEFLLAGATAIAVGTANLVNPKASIEIIEGLEKFLIKRGFESIKEIIGKAKI